MSVAQEHRHPAGPVLFARFAFPPNALGYCGPPDAADLLGSAAEGTDLRTLSALASRFEGAWPYLQLIAACNGVADPLDAAVVEAYWIGSALLDNVPPMVLAAHLDDRFERRIRRDFAAVALSAVGGGAPHHSFHVFAVYPWLGLLRAGRDRAPLVVLDQCRVRWGRVLSVDGDTVIVSDRALTFDGHRLVEGPARVSQVRRSVGGVGLSDPLVAGDAVALHWDWVCQRLSGGQLVRLRSWTRRMLQVVNTLPAPAPAVACDAQGG